MPKARNIVELIKQKRAEMLAPADRVVEDMEREEQDIPAELPPMINQDAQGMTPETRALYERLMGPIDRTPEEDEALTRETGMQPDTARMYEDTMQQDPRTGKPIAPRFQRLKGMFK